MPRFGVDSNDESVDARLIRLPVLIYSFSKDMLMQEDELFTAEPASLYVSSSASNKDSRRLLVLSISSIRPSITVIASCFS